MTAGGTGVLLVDSRKVAEGRIERTVPLFFSADEGADVGEDLTAGDRKAAGGHE